MDVRQTDKLIPWFLIPIFAVLAYAGSLHFGFSQDDFIHLAASHAGNIFDVFTFFNPFHHYQLIYFYRPLSTQFYFFVSTKLFGLNPFAMHATGLLAHVIASLLFYKLVLKIWRNRKIAAVSASLYAISAVHFLSLYYISAFQETLHVIFIFAGLIFAIDYFGLRRGMLLVLTSLCFILALLSKETSLIFPLLLIPLCKIVDQKARYTAIIKKLLPLLLILIAIAVFYVVVRFFGFRSLFGQGGYALSFSLRTLLQNTKWYMLWLFGLPEILASYPSISFATMIQFTKDFAVFGSIVVLSSMILLSTLILTMIQNIRTIWTNNLPKFTFVFLALLPVLFLSDHRYPQYLDLPLLIVLPTLVSIFYPKSGLSGRVIAIVGLCSFIVLQFASIGISQISHWTTNRSLVVACYKKQLDQALVKNPYADQISIQGNLGQLENAKVALAGLDAVKIWYPQKELSVAYQSILSAKKPNTIVLSGCDE